jgi:DNA-binding NtrC family response regulator
MTDKVQEFYQQISQAIQSPFNVMLEGESGVGKEHSARLIHQGRNWGGEFVVLDCERAVPEQTWIVEQLTSPVFFQKLRGPTRRDTLFVRRVDLLQRHLLAQLSEFFVELGKRGAFSRNKLLSLGLIGSLQTGGHENSLNNIQLYKFLDNLFCLRIRILPLRERKKEIPDLMRKFMSLFNKEQKRNVLGFHRDALGLFLQYDWPNNVSELRMEIERAVTLTRDHDSIKPAVLSDNLINSVSIMRSFR